MIREEEESNIQQTEEPDTKEIRLQGKSHDDSVNNIDEMFEVKRKGRKRERKR